MSKNPTLALGVIFLVASAVWLYILKCVYEATPFLQWLDEKHPILFIALFSIAVLSPLWLGERIERAARKK